jgi:hypothetical protein
MVMALQTISNETIAQVAQQLGVPVGDGRRRCVPSATRGREDRPARPRSAPAAWPGPERRLERRRPMTRGVRIAPSDEKRCPGNYGAAPQFGELRRMKPIADIPIRIVRLAALEAGVHEDTARRALAGRPVRAAGRERLAEALARHGVDPRVLDSQRKARP